MAEPRVGARTLIDDRCMISLQDCLALCDLTPDEVAAIGEHEHVPEIIATSLGSYLLHTAYGAEKVRDIIIDDIQYAVS